MNIDREIGRVMNWISHVHSIMNMKYIEHGIVHKILYILHNSIMEVIVYVNCVAQIYSISRKRRISKGSDNRLSL